MSDLEFFGGANDRNEGMDAAAFERFKERMAAATAQIKAIQAGEQRQRKKEDELVKILLRFIQTGQKHDIMLLVSRLLEENVPAAFIVSILLISNEEMQKELGLKLLPAGAIEKEKVQSQTLPDHYLHGEIIPLKVKITIDAWAHDIIERSHESAHRVLATALTPEGLIKLPVLQLANFCLRDYLKDEGIDIDYEVLKNFVDLMMEGIIKKVKEHYEGPRRLKGETI